MPLKEKYWCESNEKLFKLVMKQVVKAYFFGPCDITAISTFIKKKNVEFNDFNKFGAHGTCQSSYWVDLLNDKQLNHPLIYSGAYPNKTLFDDAPKIVVMSMLSEPIVGEYYDGSHTIRFGYPHLDATENYADKYPEQVKKFGEEAFENLKTHFCFKGRIDPERIVQNYRKILSSFPLDTKIVIILGPTFPSKFGEGNDYCMTVDMASTYSSINKKMVEAFGANANVTFIDPARFYVEPGDKRDLFYYNAPSILHYPRKTYKGIAKELHRLFPTTIRLDWYETKRIIRRMKRWFFGKAAKKRARRK